MEIPNSFFEDEVRNGFYISSLMKHNWAATMDLLYEFGRVLDENGLRWWVAYGSLLGTIRHGGFVPWDDDMDIFMPRDDYMKALELDKKGAFRGMRIHTMHSGKLKDEIFGTVFIDSNEVPLAEEYRKLIHDFPLIIGFDIFPLDYVDPDPEKERQLYTIVGTAVSIAANMSDTGEINQMLVSDDNKNDVYKFIRQLEKACGRKVREGEALKRQLFQMAEEVTMDSVKNKATAKMYVQRSNNISYGGHFYPMSYFNNTIYMQFECMKVPVPAEYTNLIEKFYGVDYMKPARTTFKAHDYPHYIDQIKRLKDEKNINMYNYYPTKEELLSLKDNEWANEEQRTRRLFRYLKIVLEDLNSVAQNSMADDIRADLADCQDIAVAIAEYAENEEHSSPKAVKLLEGFCERLYGVYEKADTISYREMDLFVKNELNAVEKIYDSLPDQIQKKRKIVFLPFKADKWDAFDPVWRAAKENEHWDVYVVPIPYFYKNLNGEMYDLQYDLSSYPENIHVVPWNEFDFDTELADAMIIQSPYDEYNYSTSIAPSFYSERLRQFTDKLIYIPWFVTDDYEKNDEIGIQTMDYYCLSPGVVNADITIVQSENMKNLYIEKLIKETGEETREIWGKKIRGSGSPLINRDIDFWKKELEEILK